MLEIAFTSAKLPHESNLLLKARTAQEDTRLLQTYQNCW